LKEIEPKPIPDGSGKGTFGGREKTLPDGISKKQSHYAQTLADNSEVIEDVLEEARKDVKKHILTYIASYV